MYSMLGFVPDGFWTDVTCFDLSDAVGRYGTIVSCPSEFVTLCVEMIFHKDLKPVYLKRL